VSTSIENVLRRLSVVAALIARNGFSMMRAYWSQEEVRRGQPRDWTFAPTELAAIRRRAEALERDARLAWGTR